MKRFSAARVLLVIFFLGLLLTPILVKRWSVAHQASSAKTALDANVVLARHGFYLQEVSRAAGIDFVHQGPTLDSKLAHIMPEVASMGASVSIVDFDRDGWPDIYVTNSIDFYVAHLSNVAVISVSNTASAGADHVAEEVWLHFSKVEIDFTPQDDKGKAKGGAKTFTYDAKAPKKSA